MMAAALAEGKKGGQYYTPNSIVTLIVLVQMRRGHNAQVAI
jgi:type I restriction-modification system DNA methylase subunit